MFNRVWTKSRLYRVLFGFEEWAKKRVFGCHSCGQCVLRSTSLVCPQTCPKQMRNGPCGGSMFGKCEVFPDRDCVWTKIHERADQQVMQVFDMSEKIVRIQPAVDWSLVGTSAVGSILEGKTDRHGGILSPHPVPNRQIDQLIASSKA
ncbi:MAG: methylenetetrahydrofolate reductase C-terminal domain-containing protein [Pseudomonadales bacterium]|nr:methylenetetrahydrofolate reductase C-terminal domain-containing protein [Pseudomonadales bacterium]